MKDAFCRYWDESGGEQAARSFSGIDLVLVRKLAETAHCAGECSGLSEGQRIFSAAFNALGVVPPASEPAKKATA